MDSDPFKAFECSYRYKGKLWGFELLAKDFDDAAARLQALTFGKVEGVIIGKVPVSAGPFIKAIVAARNFFHYLFAPPFP